LWFTVLAIVCSERQVLLLSRHSLVAGNGRFWPRLCENQEILISVINSGIHRLSRSRLINCFWHLLSRCGVMPLHIYCEKTPVMCWHRGFYTTNTGVMPVVPGLAA
jgi:hypothetical protein